MKKAVLLQSGEIRTEEAPIPQPRPGEALIRVHHVGICGSDIHFFHAKPPDANYPLVQGHEMSGEIVDPNGSAHLKEGDKVVACSTVFCGECEWCKKGISNRCPELRILGVTTDGCAAEYICLPENILLKIPRNLPYDTAAVLEPLSVGVHACNMAGDLSGKNVLVVGAGVIGNVTAQAAKAKGAGKVMISGRTQYRLNFAKKTGIEYLVNDSAEDLDTAVLREFGGGADVVFECIGSETSANASLRNVQNGGVVVIEGLFYGPQAIELDFVQDKEIHVVGSKIFNKTDLEESVSLLTEGKVDLASLITAHFRLEHFKDAYDHIADKSNQVMKVLLDL
ncbi:MAG: alcohol dehydrogenase catalytic domain-containing protein [Clostridiales Family XIII bacterium]|jgi:2-desacetyl-2-hydroxyethyl bacteriochlorophyllide A dehydrogenase|nr:alcohol dehydrogenase catalytic domain-containing protein [Clostridiales Family XIII bacterium]